LRELLNLIKGILGIFQLGSYLEQNLVPPLTQTGLKIRQFPNVRQETTLSHSLLSGKFLIGLHNPGFLSLV
jgi:hypothetical protein